MSKYKISFHKGLQDYVLNELKEKYPLIDIVKIAKEYIEFRNDGICIEVFRNIYSATLITDGKKTLNLSKREWRKKFVPAGLDPSIAYIMCKVANIDDNCIVYDPFCGASVLLISAILYFNAKRVICSDISGKAIEMSKQNFKTANIDMSRYLLFQSDVCDVKLNKQNIDVIISNLPFGIRVGSHKENIRSYECLESLASRVLRKKGKLVLITQEKKLLRDVFKKEDWNVKSVLQVDSGGLLPEVFLLTRRN